MNSELPKYISSSTGERTRIAWSFNPGDERIKRRLMEHIESGPAREAIALKMPHVDSVMRGYWGICDMNSPQFKAWQEWMERRAKLRGCNKLMSGKTQTYTPAQARSLTRVNGNISLQRKHISH